jgi:aryl-alcohol dehydrogenase-like predicted oxidoreductase
MTMREANPIPMTLGAAQLGMAYGINGLTEAPSQAACDAILEASWQSGVRKIDTASSYGDSEVRIGDFLKRRPDCAFRVISKLNGRVDALDSQSVISSVETSAGRLGSALTSVLLHKADQMTEWDNGLGQALKTCIDRGLVQSLGVSVYSPEEFATALKIPELELIQIPLNVLDQRWVEPQSDLSKRADALGKKIYIRSVFLQGLLVMEPDAVLRKNPPAHPWILKWRELCARIGRSPQDAAAAFVRSVAPAANLVLGCDSAEQVRVNAGLFQTPALSQQEISMFNELSSAPREVYDPRLWAKT